MIFFVNVGKKLSTSIEKQTHSFDEYLVNPNLNSFFVKSTTIHEILKLSSSLKTDKSNGPDSISPKVIKNCIQYFVDPLCDIFNKSLNTGIVPDKLKVAKIVPVYKKNDVKNVENYRPIALLSVFAKLLEKIMHKRLYDYYSNVIVLLQNSLVFVKNIVLI